MHLIRVLFFILIMLSAQSICAQQEKQFQIDIQGFQYQAVVTENTHLNDKVNGIKDNVSGQYYIGKLQGVESSWVRASLIDGQWQGVVSVHNAMHIIQQVSSGVPVGAGAVINNTMSSMPISEVDGLQGSCGRGDGTDTMLDHVAQLSATNSVDSSASASSPLSATLAQFCSQEVNGICVIAEIEIAFDQTFQTVFGAQATAQAMSIINIVDGHYINDLKISIDAITLEMLSNDLFSTSVAASPILNAGVLLDDIEDKKNNAQIPFISNNNALTHVVTGRDFNGGTLGVAYLGSVCEANGFSTGTSSVFYTNPVDTTTYNIPLTAIVVAHELAHNLGSDHDGPGANVLCPASTFIMSPGIGPGLNLANFSSCSVADIETTIAAIATPELCMDFPTDVSMAENAGNNGALNANLEFTSSYTATIENGYKAVDRVNLSGTVNTAQGILIAVVANGINCTINGGGGAYSCTVSNPPTSFQVTANVRVNANTSNIIITQTIDEDTVDVQEVNASNNSLVSTCDIANNMVMCTATSVAPTAPTAPITPIMNPGSMSEDEGGGGGNYGLGFLLLMFGVYIQTRRKPLK